MKILKRLYMRTHGFKAEQGSLLWTETIAWKRISKPESCDPKDMILEPILFKLPWKEIVKRYGKKY